MSSRRVHTETAIINNKKIRGLVPVCVSEGVQSVITGGHPRRDHGDLEKAKKNVGEKAFFHSITSDRFWRRETITGKPSSAKTTIFLAPSTGRLQHALHPAFKLYS